MGSTQAMTSSTINSPLADLAVGQRLAIFARDIKVSHTVFAMPWALLAMFMAARSVPRIGQILLILLCMISARTVAMASNRLLDAELDAKNPRTARRAIPAGQLSRRFFLFALINCAICFVCCTAMFQIFYANIWPLVFAIPVLIFLASYPLLKRFTRFCHYYLGAALALAPVCAWIAISGTIAWPPLVMAIAVLTWTAGFDIIYGCQDYDSDLQTGVISVPAKVGVARALWISRITHVVSFASIVCLGYFSPQLHVFFAIGIFAAGVLLVIEHSVVRPCDLSKVNLAFFTINGLMSLLLGTLGILDVLRH